MRRSVFVLMCVAGIMAAELGLAQGAAPAAPAHPVTEATLRQYFKVCHFGVANREALEIELAEQEKRLPEWYPRTMWNALAEEVEGLDTAAIALPVYRKYLSEEVAENAIRLLVTPEGQAMIARVYGRSVDQIAAGDSSDAARRKALEAEQEEEDAHIRQMLQSMTATDREAVNAFVRSEEWADFQGVSAQLRKEFAGVYVERQKEVARQFREKHSKELEKAREKYMRAHPEAELSARR